MTDQNQNTGTGSPDSGDPGQQAAQQDPGQGQPQGGQPEGSQQGQPEGGQPQAQGVADDPVALQEAAVAAMKEWRENPSAQTFEAAEQATMKASGAVTKAKEAAQAAKKTKDEAEAQAAAEAAKNKPPEKYELKLPEKSLLTQADIEETEQIAKELGLTQERAQAFLNHKNDVLQRYTAANLPGGEEWSKRLDEWESQCLADPQLGGGNKETLAQHAEVGKRVLAKLADDEMVEFLQNTGYGSNPVVMRFLSRIGKVLGEDYIRPTGPAPQGQRSPEEVLYGKKKEPSQS